MKTKKGFDFSVLMGAAFLMATSSIGPGFLTQTTVFTEQLLASFGFVILTSIILDIGSQLNVWRVIGISGKRGQDVANMVLPGLGYVVAALIVMAASVTSDGSNAVAVYLGAFLAGVGAGAVSAHASNVVALALPERDASQSGGIQSTMRNVGQAIGVALLGAILLLGITNAVRANAADDPSISPQVSKEVSALTIDLGSNEAFEGQISGIPMTDDERSQLVAIEEKARYDSVRIAYVAGAAIVLLGLATTPAIKITSSDQRKPGKDRKEGEGN